MSVYQTITNRTLEKTFVTNEYAYYDDIFTKDELKKIIKLHSEMSLSDGSVGGTKTDTNIRVSKITHQTPDQNNQWIFDKLNSLIMQANWEFFGYDLTGYDLYQYAEYDAKDSGHYDYHTDIIYGGKNLNSNVQLIETRKLSMTLLLNDPEVEFEGGEFYIINDQQRKIEFIEGRAILFPSYVLHRVAPVTKGIRKSLVVWVKGPKFK
jgi:PKHD-type hydroxylase